LRDYGHDVRAAHDGPARSRRRSFIARTSCCSTSVCPDSMATRSPGACAASSG
jgi:hypothetical protein